MYYSLGAARGTQSNGPGAPPRSRRTRPEPFLADAGSGPGNCAGMEETTGAPSSFAALSPRRLRASSRDGGGVVNRPPSPLTMLLSRHTRRRELLTLLCGGGAGIFGLQIEASAQTPTTARRVAFVVSTGPVNQREHEFFRAFVDELRSLGYVEGRHLTLEGYSGEGRFDRLAELARSIVETGPEVIVAATDPVARAFNEATATIPLVVACSDPVALGFAQSMARPGGNITGIAVYAGPVILEKYVEIIREIDPRILRIGVLAQKLSWEKHHDTSF